MCMRERVCEREGQGSSFRTIFVRLLDDGCGITSTGRSHQRAHTTGSVSSVIAPEASAEREAVGQSDA